MGFAYGRSKEKGDPNIPELKVFEIPFKTPTINHLYWHKGNMKIMKKEAKELREQICNIVKGDHEYLRGKKLRVAVFIYENWHTKKGDVKKKDVANREKFLIDSVFEGMGLDDKFIFEHHIFKRQSNSEFAQVEVEELKS